METLKYFSVVSITTAITLFIGLITVHLGSVDLAKQEYISSTNSEIETSRISGEYDFNENTLGVSDDICSNYLNKDLTYILNDFRLLENKYGLDHKASEVYTTDIQNMIIECNKDK